MQYFMQMQLAAQLQQSSGPYLIIMILALLLGLLFFIFAGYQLLAGVLMLLQKQFQEKMFISMTYLLHSKKVNMVRV